MKATGPSRAELLRAAAGGILVTAGALAAKPSRGDSAMLTRPIPSTGEAMPVLGQS